MGYKLYKSWANAKEVEMVNCHVNFIVQPDKNTINFLVKI